jgi:hypothetical protein
VKRSAALLAAVLACASLAAAGCAEREAGVADRIRAVNSPIVRRVFYQSSNILDPAEVDVYVGAGTTQAQAQRLWCDVIVPAGGDATFVALWRGVGWFSVNVDPTCPVPSPWASPDGPSLPGSGRIDRWSNVR